MTNFNFSKQRGFNLVEVAIALVILALALGGVISAFAPQLSNRGFTTTQAQLAEAAEAVLAFAETNGRLPCPATSTSGGLESFCSTPTGLPGCVLATPVNNPTPSRGRCSAAPAAGFVPALTLGLVGQGSRGTVVDAWAGTLQYVVTAVTSITNANLVPVLINPACDATAPNTCSPFTQINGIKNAYYNQPITPGPPPAGPTLPNPASDIFICNATTAGPGCLGVQLIANPAFAVFSQGRVRVRPVASADEAANTDNNRLFVSRERTDDAAPIPFDDLFVWATIDKVRSRMAASKVVP